jgi:hypothetical protein
MQNVRAGPSVILLPASLRNPLCFLELLSYEAASRKPRFSLLGGGWVQWWHIRPQLSHYAVIFEVSAEVVAVVAADGICDAYVVLSLADEIESVSEDQCAHLHSQPPIVLLRVSSSVDYGR